MGVGAPVASGVRGWGLGLTRRRMVGRGAGFRGKAWARNPELAGVSEVEAYRYSKGPVAGRGHGVSLRGARWLVSSLA